VNALPPLKVVQLLGNACLSPTTLAPKDPFRSCVETALHELFSLFSEEPHRVTSNDLVGALGAGPRPEGVGRPAAWLATVSRRCHSVDVFQRDRFLFPRQPPTSPLPKSHPSVSRASPFASVDDNNHHSFTYAASVAERNGLKPSGSDPASGVPPAPDGPTPEGWGVAEAAWLAAGSNGHGSRRQTIVVEPFRGPVRPILDSSPSRFRIQDPKKALRSDRDRTLS
jgi:hypothetical protein